MTRRVSLIGGGWILCAALLGAAVARGATETPLPGPFEHLRVVDFPGEIGALLAAYVDRQVQAAEEEGVDCLVLRIESPGGTVFHSMEIGDRLLELPDRIHVVAWVPKEAYSGAALVALACDEIVMGRDAHLGDAQPILLGAEGPKPVGEKIETVLRAKFRAYAQRNGYPIPLAEAMVSASVEVLQLRDPTGALHYVGGPDYRDADPQADLVPGWKKQDLVQVGPAVVREGALLTLTADEAQRFGFLRRTFAEGAAFPDSEQGLLEALRAPGGQVEQVALSFSEQMSRTLLDIAGVLSALVALALLVTLFQGVGTFTIVGAVALVLVLLINATAAQLHGFPLFLLALGALLLAAEVFLIPGFGVAGILGIGALGVGFLMLAVGIGGFEGGEPLGDRREQAIDFGLQFVVTVLAGIGLLLFLSRLFPRLGPGRRLVLTAPGGPPVSARDAELMPRTAVGARGVARSVLRPAGTAEFDGRLVDVVTDGPFLARGDTVEVIAIEGNRVTVRAAHETPPAREDGL